MSPHESTVAPPASLPKWDRHIIEHLRVLLLRSPDPALSELLAEIESSLPPLPEESNVLGLAVQLELASSDATDLRLTTTITSFTTATDVTLADLQLEAFLAADDRTAEVLRRRWA
jgi:hypothetical protein